MDWAGDGHALIYVSAYAPLGKPEAFYIRATGTGFTRVTDDLPAHSQVDFADRLG